MATSMDQLSAAQMKSVVQNFMDENVPCQVEYKVILTRNETGPPSRALEGTDGTLDGRFALFLISSLTLDFFLLMYRWDLHCL